MSNKTNFFLLLFFSFTNTRTQTASATRASKVDSSIHFYYLPHRGRSSFSRATKTLVTKVFFRKKKKRGFELSDFNKRADRKRVKSSFFLGGKKCLAVFFLQRKISIGGSQISLAASMRWLVCALVESWNFYELCNIS